MFENNGVETAAQYAMQAAQATSSKAAVGVSGIWDGLDPKQAINRRWIFILKILREAISGLAFMHQRGRLHQSIGPNSLVLSTLEVRRWLKQKIHPTYYDLLHTCQGRLIKK